MSGRLVSLSLLLSVVAVAAFTVAGWSKPGEKEKPKDSSPKSKPYVRVGHHFSTTSGQANVRGDVTAFSGLRVKELKLGVVVLKGGKEIVVDERRLLVDEEAYKPSEGVVSLQYLPTGKGEARRYELVLGCGYSSAKNSIPKSSRQPNAVTVERPPLSHNYSLTEMAAETLHVVRVDVIEGEITKEGSYVLRGNPLSSKIMKDKTLKLGRLKELSEKAEKETIIATTIWWKGYD